MIDKSKLLTAIKLALPGEWAHVKSTSALVGGEHYRVNLVNNNNGSVDVIVESTLTDKEVAGVTTSTKSMYKNSSAIETIATILTEQVNNG